MYLPVLLIDRLGWAGFVAFAVPNVIGCAGMAFVLHAIARRRCQTTGSLSQQVTVLHAPMMAAFSLFTVAFQIFFAVWLVDELIPRMDLPWWAPLIVAGVIYALGLLFSFFGDRDWAALAVVTYVISISAMVMLGTGGFDRVPMSGFLPPSHAWWLLPTLCFGFLLCPYLDATFHRAAQSASHPRLAFGFFGIMFAIMICITVMLWFNPDGWYRPMVALLMLGHIIAQLIFTTGAHLRELRTTSAFCCRLRRSVAMALPIMAIALLAAARLFLRDPDAGEWTYLTFLVCYGLVFPAYVIVAMATGRPLVSRSEWIGFIAMVVMCLPLMALGFLFDQTPWLVAPVGLFMIWGHLRRNARSPARTA